MGLEHEPIPGVKLSIAPQTAGNPLVAVAVILAIVVLPVVAVLLFF